MERTKGIDLVNKSWKTDFGVFLISQSYSATGKYSLELKLLLMWTIVVIISIKNVLCQNLTPVMQTKSLEKKLRLIGCTVSGAQYHKENENMYMDTV